MIAMREEEVIDILKDRNPLISLRALIGSLKYFTKI